MSFLVIGFAAVFCGNPSRALKSRRKVQCEVYFIFVYLYNTDFVMKKADFMVFSHALTSLKKKNEQMKGARVRFMKKN